MPEIARSTHAESPASSEQSKIDSRNVWIVTGYIAAILALLAVLAYHFSEYLFS
jgi:hypothetical protein